MQSLFRRGLNRNTLLLSLASLLGDVSTEMLYPVLPLFLTQTLGAGGSVVGLVEGIASATQNVMQGVAGTLSDRYGRRKPFALAGYLLAALAKPLIGVASVWQGALGGRFLDRVGAGLRSAPRDALIAASVEEADRGKAFGLESAGDNAGAFLGPLLAILLLIVLGLDIRWIFYLAVIPGLLAVLMIAFVREPAGAAVAARSRLELRPARLPRDYWKFLAAAAVFGIGNSSSAFLILAISAAGAPLLTTILIYAGFNLVAALVSYPAGLLSDRIGRRDILLVAFGIFIVTYLGFALSGSLVVIGGLFVAYGLFQGMFRTAGKALAGSLAPEPVRASGLGLYSAAVGLSGLVAGLAGGWLWDHAGHASVFLFGAASAVAGSLALVVLVPRRLPAAGAP